MSAQSSWGRTATRFRLCTASISADLATSGSEGAEEQPVDVAVRGQRCEHLVAAAGQDVHDAAGHVGGVEHFAEGHRGQRLVARHQDDGRVAAGDRGGDSGDQAEQRRLGRQHTDDAHRFEDREVEVRGGDRVDAGEDLLELVRPAGVVEEPVDGGLDFGPRPRPGPRRRPRAGPRTVRYGPPASRRSGRESGPGCRRCARPSRPGRREPRSPRPARPCASSGRCSRSAFRRAPGPGRSGRIRSAGTCRQRRPCGS